MLQRLTSETAILARSGLWQFVSVLREALAPVPVTPLVLPEDDRIVMPGLTWARAGGTTRQLNEGRGIQRPTVELTVWSAKGWLEAEGYRLLALDALREASVLVEEPEPPDDVYVYDPATQQAQGGTFGVTAMTTVLHLAST